uniref:Sema domain-containing protein n=1 Tax=Syphacia muris TaxID=451379 RepID=A0A0N5AIK0_9BILA
LYSKINGIFTVLNSKGFCLFSLDKKVRKIYFFRNALFNISLDTLEERNSLEWIPDKDAREDCIKKGKSKEVECHNYIRVFIRQDNGRVLVCGTYAYSPKCREYEEKSFQQEQQFDGQALSPYDPRHNSTILFVPGNGKNRNSVSDFAGNDPLIYWKPLSFDSDGVRTQRDDVKILDSPNFVGSFEYGKYVYFWFREWAAESNTFDREVYARVARICKNDRGGRGPTARNRWTTFLKARLNCSIASATPFYFNELQAITKPMRVFGTDVVYALFTTPASSFQMSAICIFAMKTVEHIFDHGDFKVKENPQSLWISHKYSSQYRNLPLPRPGSCPSNSSVLNDAVISFLSRNAIMHSAIPSFSTGPIYVQGPEKAHFTRIAVLPQLKAVSGIFFNAIYLGTADGHLVKLIETDTGLITVVESIRVFKNKLPVVDLAISKDRMVVVSADEVATVPLQNCDMQVTCHKCVGLQDGYCAWNSLARKCQEALFYTDFSFIQNLSFGFSSRCYGMPGNVDYNIDEGDDCDACARLTTNDLLIAGDHYSYVRQVNGDVDGLVRPLTLKDRGATSSSASTVTTPIIRTFPEKSAAGYSGTLTMGYKAKQVYL